MDRRIVLFIFILSFMIIPFASAYQKEVPLSITVGCDKINCSLAWNITVLNPNSSILINNQVMSVGDYYANYSLTPTETGTFLVFLSDTTGSDNYDTSFDVTYAGEQLTTSQGILYGSLYLVLILFIIAVLLIMNLLPDENTKSNTGEILSISFLKYLRGTLWIVEWVMLIAVLYLSSNLAFAYLSETLFANIFFVLFRICFGITPIIVIVWVIWLIAKIIQDKEIHKLLNRGMFKQAF